MTTDLLSVVHGAHETHPGNDDGHLLLGHTANETQSCYAEHLLSVVQVVDETHFPYDDGHLLLGQRFDETQDGLAEHLPPPAPTNQRPHSKAFTSGWVELRICADLLARSQDERKAVGNMLRHTDADLFSHHLEQLEATEHQARLMLRRCYRRVVPAELQQMVKANRGLGEDITARILGHLGDPYVATPHWWDGTGSNRTLMVGEPYIRSISQLWSYCGHGDPARKPVKGMTADDMFAMGSPRLKMLVHLAAECAMKSGKPGDRYRDIYDAAKANAADKVHAVKCPQCVGSSNPGDPWRPGHQHAHALRIVGKEILRDMWLARHEVETR